jgi:hypothetical protein
LSDNSIWFGPYRIDLVLETIDSIPVRGNTEFLGGGADGRAFALQQDSGHVLVLVSPSERFSEFSEYLLQDAPLHPDATSLHGKQELLALGYSLEGVLRLYRLESLNPTEDLEHREMLTSATLFPSRLPAYRSSWVTIRGMEWPSFFIGRSIPVSIVDILGRPVYQEPVRITNSPNQSFMIEFPPLQPGMFFCSVPIGDKTYFFSIVVAM